MAGNALVLFFLLTILLLVSELYFRFVYDTTESLGYTKIAQAWVQRHWHKNLAGVRDDIEYLSRLRPGQRRVTFVGDSFTVGYGIKDVSNRFVNRIRKAHPEWEVHMLAEPGLDTGDEIRVVSQELASGYQIDTVVLVYCLNDIADIVPEWLEAKKHFPDEVNKGGFFVRHSYFINLLYHRIRVRQNPYLKDYYGFVREAYAGPLWGDQKERLKTFRELVESHGGRLFVVTFPFLQAVGTNYEYQFVHDELNQTWRAFGVPNLDLLNVYRGLGPKQITVNRYDAHPNEYASALASKAIDAFLQQQLDATQHSPNPK